MTLTSDLIQLDTVKVQVTTIRGMDHVSKAGRGTELCITICLDLESDPEGWMWGQKHQLLLLGVLCECCLLRSLRNKRHLS